MKKILLIEDDIRLAELISEYLCRYDFNVVQVLRGDQALSAIAREQPDVVILDLMLPGMDGMDICRQLRKSSALPVLMLTARADIFDQVTGLEIGADDYMLKPVQPRLLLAHLRAILRRQENHPDSSPNRVLRFGELQIDLAARQVCWKGNEIDLKTSDYNLFVILVQAAGHVLSRDELLRRWRGIDFDGMDRTVDVSISRLRRRFNDDAQEPRKIKTVWGRGYLFSPIAWEE
ncbi:response regulator [Herbaspirillum autotrophicum]|uniref:response regulator n=1 Tax=Herbaspirillum autotrophicum TaxID=180195 RepID=UPI00067C4154|nr:response regulator [Herbaspirillum autotrophicum]